MHFVVEKKIPMIPHGHRKTGVYVFSLFGPSTFSRLVLSVRLHSGVLDHSIMLMSERLQSHEMREFIDGSRERCGKRSIESLFGIKTNINEALQ